MKNDFAREIEDALQEYASVSSETLKKVIEETGKEAAKELKKTAPKLTGDYASSWKWKKVSETTETIKSTVYASKGEYRKTHLLEKGHAKRGGGRTRAFPHIKNAEKRAISNIEKRLKDRL